MSRRAGRWLVVSPHCDDAVLSLGATISHLVRRGGDVTVVTVLAGDSTSDAPSGPWDRAAGFATAGEAARRRRDEDVAACRALGAQVVHLDGVDEQYRTEGDGVETWVAEMGPLADRHDVVLVPGHPLWHPDHRAVAEHVTAALVGADVRLYVEEPYASWADEPEAARPDVEWERRRAPLVDRLRKVRALTCYRSQIPLLATPDGDRRRFARARLLALVWSRTTAGERVSLPLTSRASDT